MSKNDRSRLIIILTSTFVLFNLPRSHADGNSAIKMNLNDAVITALSGQVKILKRTRNLRKTPIVKYRGRQYSFSFAKVGTLVQPGSIVIVPVHGRARLIYNNGDQLNLGPGTEVVLRRKNRGEFLKLNYGNLRAIISKNGPRKRSAVRTPSTTMGVRGTDFFVNEGRRGTQVVVVRGRVKFSPHQISQTELIEAGAAGKIGKRVENVSHTRATRQDFESIRELTDIKPVVTKQKNESVKTLVMSLERNAFKATREDVDDPKLDENNFTSAQQLNSHSLNQKIASAPPETNRLNLESGSSNSLSFPESETFFQI